MYNLKIKIGDSIINFKTPEGKNVDAIIKDINAENIINAGYPLWARYISNIENDIEIGNNRIIVNAKHRHNQKLMYDIIIINKILIDGKNLNENTYRKEVYRFLSIGLENLYPTQKEMDIV